MRLCGVCRQPLDSERAHYHRACYKRAQRRWAQGLAATAFPDGGRRGRVPMSAGPTKKERELQAAFENGYELCKLQQEVTSAADGLRAANAKLPRGELLRQLSALIRESEEGEGHAR